MQLHIDRWGDGPPVLLVHGSVTSGMMTWATQRPLSSRWSMLMISRRGCFPNPPGDGEDFEADADDVAALLTEPMHMVGHSYGAIAALLAAARRPDMVRSLTVSEPPTFNVASHDPAAAALTQDLLDLWNDGPEDPGEFLRMFLTCIGGGVTLPDPLPPPLLQNARMLRGCRLPWKAVIPLAELRRAGLPTLVVSGGHSRAFEAVCDVLEQALNAERAVVAGAGHSVPRTGAPYNEVLASFLDRSPNKVVTLSRYR